VIILKRILIIGAGFLQTFVIKKAKSLGYYTIAVDVNKNAEGFLFCDEYATIDIVDENACLEYAKKMNIDGVLTAATDYGVLSVAHIAKELNLVGADYDSVKRVKNKYQVRKSLSDAGADDTGTCYEIKDPGEINDLKDKIVYPVMVKPCDGSGSRGAHKAETFQEFEKACIDALDNSLSKRALIEPFISGREYGVESFVYDGEVNVLAIMGKTMTEPPYYAELGHFVPSGLSKETEDKIKACVKKAIVALNVDFGSVNMDILVTDKGDVHIVDVGARMGGNLIGSHIIPLAMGIPYIENMIRAAVGDEVDFKPQSTNAVATRILALTPGVVASVPDFKAIEKECNVIIEHHIKVGDTINEYHTNLDGCGYVVSCEKTIDDAKEKALSVKELIDKSLIKQN